MYQSCCCLQSPSSPSPCLALCGGRADPIWVPSSRSLFSCLGSAWFQLAPGTDKTWEGEKQGTARTFPSFSFFLKTCPGDSSLLGCVSGSPREAHGGSGLCQGTPAPCFWCHHLLPLPCQQRVGAFTAAPSFCTAFLFSAWFLSPSFLHNQHPIPPRLVVSLAGLWASMSVSSHGYELLQVRNSLPHLCTQTSGWVPDKLPSNGI